MRLMLVPVNVPALYFIYLIFFIGYVFSNCGYFLKFNIIFYTSFIFLYYSKYIFIDCDISEDFLLTV